jgi:Fe-S cluster biosynthesis and repair protein YggX
MARVVFCQLLKREAQGLEAPPHPGAIGQRIYENISSEGWTRWLTQLTVIINDYGLNTADPSSIPLIEQHMLGYLFGEGDFANPSAGYAPPPRRKK